MKKFTESTNLELTLDTIIDIFLSIEDIGFILLIKDHSGDLCYRTHGNGIGNPYINHKNFEINMNDDKKMFIVEVQTNSDNSIKILKDLFTELDVAMNRIKNFGFFIKELDITKETFSFPYKVISVQIKITNKK